MTEQNTTLKDKRRTPPKGDRAVNFVLREAGFVPAFDKVTSVAVVAFTDAGKIIAVVEHRGADLPGGHVDQDETIFEQTARRETYEEARVRLGELKFVRAIESDFYGADDITYMVIMTAKVAAFEGEPEGSQRLELTAEEFLARHTAFRPELMEQIVNAAVAESFGTAA
jgi:8-oxo-dGTP diphosphatase